MLFITATNVDLYRFCASQNIPRSTAWQLIKCYRLWLSTLGPETTIKRLKSLKVGLISGSVPQQESWISVKTNGRPKGPFGFLWSSHLGLTRSLNVITAFISNITSSVLTVNQWKKFILSATREEIAEDFHLHFHDLPAVLNSYSSTFKEESVKANYDDIERWTSSPTRKALIPLTHPDGRYVSVIENTVLPSDHYSWLKILKFPAKDRAYDSMLKYYVDACRGLSNTPCGISFSGDKLVSGSVSVIQERGMKARVIANPLRVHQVVLSKLGNFLFAVARRLPWDCSFNQDKGIEFGIQALKSGKTVFCHDLSDATNNFPLEFSEFMLNNIREILPSSERAWFQDHTELFSIIARGKWQAPKNLPESLNMFLEDNMYIRWTVGQPLGLYPSFPLFALSHGFLLRLVEYRLGACDTFRILGDDVLITDKRVSDSYLKMLSILDVPVSKEKSLTSDKTGEFAGKIFTKKGRLKVEKWKDVKMSFLDIVRWLGPPGLSLVPSRYRKVAAEIAYMPKPLGLGMNINVLPFYQRIPEHFEEQFIRSEEVTTALPNPVKDRRAEFELEVNAAYNNGIYFGVEYGPKCSRESIDPIFVDHINSLWDYYGFIPERHMSLWEAVRDLTFRSTRFRKANKYHIGRFFFLYRIRKRHLRHKREANPKIDSG